ncbi:hypothetical protein RRG08_033213 [Elysia crispata]|uniref:Uncharacterized protein n=1 Tax=Elysia crispata TaxID=231223 RepID=A0AAE1BA29_9GAST|nr:hypothetical protein RRG08_033213 [Elysia crispata]
METSPPNVGWRLAPRISGGDSSPTDVWWRLAPRMSGGDSSPTDVGWRLAHGHRCYTHERGHSPLAHLIRHKEPKLLEARAALESWKQKLSQTSGQWPVSDVSGDLIIRTSSCAVLPAVGDLYTPSNTKHGLAVV